MTLDPLFDDADLWTLSQLLKRLVGVKPLVATRELRGRYLDALLVDAATFDIGAAALPTDVGNEWFRRNNLGLDCVTPYGAALLVDLYKAGHLPMSRVAPQPISEDVQAYIGSFDELVSKYAVRQAAQAESMAREAAWIAQPETIPESELTYGLLSRVFRKHRIVGMGEMEIGGLTVRKQLRRFFSNSGKSDDYEVTFIWNSSAGETKSIKRPSTYSDNRRNDCGRNYGLPD